MEFSSSSLISMLSVGSSVRIHPNAPSTHAGMTGKVVVMPVHPITWFKVKMDAGGEVAMFRSSNLVPLDERGEVRQDYLLSRLSQAQTRTSRVSSGDNGTKVSPPPTTASDAENGGRPVRKRFHMSTAEDDADPYVVESDYSKPRKTRPYTAPKQSPSASNLASTMLAFDAYGACLNCGVMRWTAGRFCWNELCTSSPIYWKLPGCRGGQTPAAAEVVGILMALSSVAGPSPAAPQRVRADSNISSDGSGIFASSESSSSLQSLM